MNSILSGRRMLFAVKAQQHLRPSFRPFALTDCCPFLFGKFANHHDRCSHKNSKATSAEHSTSTQDTHTVARMVHGCSDCSEWKEHFDDGTDPCLQTCISYLIIISKRPSANDNCTKRFFLFLIYGPTAEILICRIKRENDTNTSGRQRNQSEI